MDDYELQQVLEAMAGAAALPTDADDNIEAIEQTAERWHKLFDLSTDEAMDSIVRHRNDLTRVRVSDEHWSQISAEKKAAGYDREAYEFELNLEKQKAAMARAIPQDDGDMTYLVELSDALPDAEAVRAAAGMMEKPEVVAGFSSESWTGVRLCCVDAKARGNILRWAVEQGRGYEPTILINPKSM